MIKPFLKAGMKHISARPLFHFRSDHSCWRRWWGHLSLQGRLICHAFLHAGVLWSPTSRESTIGLLRDHTWMSSDKNSWILRQQRANGITKPVYQDMNTHGLWCSYSWMDLTLDIVIFDDFPGGKSLRVWVLYNMSGLSQWCMSSLRFIQHWSPSSSGNFGMNCECE